MCGMDEVGTMLVKAYMVLTRTKVLKPNMFEFTRICKDVGINASALLGFIEVGLDGAVKVNHEGEEFIRLMLQLIKLGSVEDEHASGIDHGK